MMRIMSLPLGWLLPSRQYNQSVAQKSCCRWCYLREFFISSNAVSLPALLCLFASMREGGCARESFHTPMKPNAGDGDVSQRFNNGSCKILSGG
mmetsp:Transcript_21671/g.39770  ORF Transcript_21671/g.39770 Transcript_21671/m.39770 type:complete len:94 (+) Transcript_21671:1337-1618(+)